MEREEGVIGEVYTVCPWVSRIVWEIVRSVIVRTFSATTSSGETSHTSCLSLRRKRGPDDEYWKKAERVSHEGNCPNREDDMIKCASVRSVYKFWSLLRHFIEKETLVAQWLACSRESAFRRHVSWFSLISSLYLRVSREQESERAGERRHRYR